MTGELIVFFKSRAELDADWQAMFEAYVDGYHKICREHDLVVAVEKGNADVLAKASADEIAAAKSEVARSDGSHGASAIECLRRLEKHSRDYIAALAEHKRLKARSEKFLRRIGH